MKKKFLCILLTFALTGIIFPMNAISAFGETPGTDNANSEKVASDDYATNDSAVANNSNATDTDVRIGVETGATSNIPDKRPVWNVAHRCNTNVWRGLRKRVSPEKSEVQKAINGGCNGVEVDVRRSTWGPWHKGQLILCHDATITERYSETVREFLQMDVWKNPQMCLVIWDIKEPQIMDELMKLTHAEMDRPNSTIKGVNFIYSVGALSDVSPGFIGSMTGKTSLFEDIVDDLRPNEGICVDMDWNTSADDVEKTFDKLDFDRCWYGNGIDNGGWFVNWKDTKTKIPKNCKRAVEIRDGKTSFGPNPNIKKVESWTVATMAIYMERMGNWNLDSVMLNDHMRNKKEDGRPVSSFLINKINQQKDKNQQIRLANRADNPFVKWGT